ncbi:unnamed protein product [Chrysoparadoxa australica]
MTVYFNVVEKKLLEAFPSPLIVASLHLAIGVACMVPLWLLGIRKPPKLSPYQARLLAPVAFWHGLQHAMGTSSMAAGSMGGAHLVKAAEPFFSVLMSWLLAGERYHPLVLLCLIPVVGGVMVAAGEMTLTQSVIAYSSMANIAVACRGVTAKSASIAINREKENMCAVKMFAVLTTMSFGMLLPIALIREGATVLQAWERADKSHGSSYLTKELLWSSLLYYITNELAFVVCSKLGPVTYSVSNTVKRAAILLASTVVFGATVSGRGLAGAAASLLGAMSYGVAKVSFPPLEKLSVKKQV